MNGQPETITTNDHASDTVTISYPAHPMADVTLAEAVDTAPPGRIILLADGDIMWAALDGVELNAKSARQIIAAFKQRGVDIPIDYHHATETDAAKAPAAGWVRGLEYKQGVGLIGTDIEWTAEAATFIRTKQYKYFSPVITVDKKTKAIRTLESVALTNKPRTEQQTELLRQAASRDRQGGRKPAQHGDSTMTKTKASLRLLGHGLDADDATRLKEFAEELLPDVEVDVEALPDDQVSDLDEVGAAVASLAEALGLDEGTPAVEVINAAIAGLAEAAESDDAKESATRIAAALGTKSRDSETICAEVAALKIKAEQFDEMETRVAGLEAARIEERVETLCAEQVERGVLNPDDEKAMASARSLAEKDEAGFTALFAGLQPSIQPGQVTKQSATRTASKRSDMIKAARDEWVENDQGKGMCTLPSYVNVKLMASEQPTLTAAERDKL